MTGKEQSSRSGPEREFHACKFRQGDRRTYTFHFDPDPVVEDDVQIEVGDHVECQTRHGRDVVIVAVANVPEPKSFKTSPIFGISKKGKTSA